MKLETFKVLSESEVKEIHKATVDILENCGVKVLSKKMLEFLKGKGLDVDEDKQIVRFSQNVIEDSMSLIPEKFDVFDRNGEFVFTLGDRKPKVAAGHNAVFWVDSETGLTRPSTVADVEQFARICQQLDVIDMIGIPVMPQDVPDPNATLLYGVKACVENSVKPIYFSTDSCKVNRACIDILEAAFAGDFKHQVYGITQLSPTSPLYWEKGVLDAFMDTMQTNVPIAILPEPIAGVSCPYTLAGLLTMNNAECLSGLVMIQLLKPRHKIMYANSWTTSDMRNGSALVGSTETTICRIAAAQLAQFYKAPSHTTAPNSDNHAHDEQNSWEKTFSQFCALGAGHDLIVNCGMFATGLTCSHEQLLMDAEISAMAKRIVAGLRVDKETIAVDLIKKIGPQGDSYLTTDHTINWLRSGEYVRTQLAVTGSKAAWDKQGSKDTYELARDLVKNYPEKPEKKLSDKSKKVIEEIIGEFSK
ncbi:MAG: trimethylamine methyltransferase family protein [Sedimentisphaerales bacterium]|nr:trimethylamine methyltransferase family protein [Sedimentisphaerales bacterium]